MTTDSPGKIQRTHSKLRRLKVARNIDKEPTAYVIYIGLNKSRISARSRVYLHVYVFIVMLWNL